MKRFVGLVMVLLLVLTAAGCRQEPAQTPTQPATTAPVETTEPQPALTARDVYWKMRNALGMACPNGYTTEQILKFKIGTGILAKRAECQQTEQVVLSLEPLKFNISMEIIESVGGAQWMTQTDYYYRSRGSDKADLYIYYGEPWNKWVYSEPTDYNYSVVSALQHMLYPTEFPADMTLDPEIKRAENRNAYVLRYTESAESVIGGQVPEDADEKFKNLQVYHTLYVDAETFVLLRTVEEIEDPGEAVSKAMYEGMMGEAYEGEDPLQVTSFKKTFRALQYGQVEIPEIPKEAFGELDGFGTV